MTVNFYTKEKIDQLIAALGGTAYTDAETARAQNAESNLATGLTNEQTRAQNAEASLAPLVESLDVASISSGTYTIKNPVTTGKTSSRLTFTGSATVALPDLSASVSSGKMVSITVQYVQDSTGGWTVTLPTASVISGTAPTVVKTANTVTELVYRYDGSSQTWSVYGNSSNVMTVVQRTNSQGPYTANSNELVEINTTGAGSAVTYTLPAAAVATGDIVLKWIQGTVAPLIALTGTDHVNYSSNSGVPSFTQVDQAHRFTPDGNALWVKSGMDLQVAKLAIPGIILGRANFAPSTAQTDATTTNTSLTDVAAAAAAASTPWTGNSSTMFDVSFQVPSSGIVIVRAQAWVKTAASGTGVKFGVYDVGAAAFITGTSVQVQAGTGYARTTYEYEVSGLTPGALLTYRWQWGLAGAGTATISVGGTNGPARFSVVCG